MKLYIVCDYRENLTNYITDANDIYNDHPSKKNIDDIMNAISSLGYACEYFGGIPELIHAVDYHKKYYDCYFLNLTDGLDQNYSRVQAPVLLDILNVPYSGSDVFASVLMNNKHYCKQALSGNNINMPNSCIVNSIIPLNQNRLKNWSYPIFVKPNCEGSSLGITKGNVCHNYKEVKNKVYELLGIFKEVIIEEYVEGIDVTNYLIGNKETYYINDVIVAELLDQSPYAVYGLEEKHNKLRNLYYNEEKLPHETVKKIQLQSIKIANLIGVKDICRIDYRLDTRNQNFSFIEINSAPRFSTTSEIGFIAQKRNCPFSKIVEFYLKTFIDRIK